MTILLLTESAAVVGGAEKVALESALGLAAAGHEVIVFAASGPIDPRLLDVPRLRVECLGLTSFYRSASKLGAVRRAFWNREAAERLGVVLSELDPSETVVHAHSYLRVLTASVLDAALDAGFEVVVTLHDYGLACPAMSFYNVPKQQICRLRPMSAACRTTQCTARGWPNKLGILLRTSRMLGAGIPRRLRHFVAVSRFSADIMRPYLPPSARIEIVRNPGAAAPGERVEAERNRHFAFLGRLTPEKDPALLARAAHAAGAPALFIGDGPEADRVRAEMPGAEVTGWTEADEVERQLSRARALVLTSRWYEAAPLVVGEARSRGIPVFVSDACAGQEEIQDEVDGKVFASGDASALAALLTRAQDDAWIETLSRNAFERYAAAPPTLEQHVGQLENVYRSALAGRLPRQE